MRFKSLQLLIVLLLLGLTAVLVYAVPNSGTVTDVRYTVHNLSNTDNINLGITRDGRNFAASSSGQADQVCVFCHTPHSASPAIPLWNKVYTAGVESTYRLYTSSKTLTNAAKNASITANSVSLICLSCHDGKTAINVLHNSSFRDSTDVNGDAVINIDGTLGGPGKFALGDMWSGSFTNYEPANLGAVRTSTGPYPGSIPSAAAAVAGINLTDDHPIGFDYATAVGQDGGGLLASPAAGIRLFNGRVECSSCHNPHVYYGSGMVAGTRLYYDTDIANTIWADDTQKSKKPFLNISNNGSNLCKGCHNK